MAHSTPMTAPLRRSGGLAALVVALLVAACGPPPRPLTQRRHERRARHDARRPRRPSRPRRRPRPRLRPPATPPPPGVAGYARPRHERPERRPVLGDRGPGQPAPRASRQRSPSSAACSTRPRLCAYITSSFEKDNPASSSRAPRRLYKALGLMPQDAVAPQPLHRAAHQPGRGPVRRRDQEDVRRHEHGRHRAGREDHLRPRVHPRAPGPAVHAARHHRRREGPGRPRRSPARPSSRATRRCSCRSGPSSTSRPAELARGRHGRRPGLGGDPRADAGDPQGRRSCSRTRAASSSTLGAFQQGGYGGRGRSCSPTRPTRPSRSSTPRSSPRARRRSRSRSRRTSPAQARRRLDGRAPGHARRVPAEHPARRRGRSAARPRTRPRAGAATGSPGSPGRTARTRRSSTRSWDTDADAAAVRGRRSRATSRSSRPRAAAPRCSTPAPDRGRRDQRER